jgi:sortase (surface protein transpeptidase)
MSILRSPWALRRKTQRIAMCFGVLTILLSMLAPVVMLQAASAAQDLTSRQDPPACEPGFVHDPGTGECVPEEEPTPVRSDAVECGEGESVDAVTGECVPANGGTDTFQADPTTEPVLGDPPQQAPSAVHVTLYECPAHADPSAPWDELTALCSTPASAPVTITHGVEGGGETPQAVTGSASWPDLPPGSHYLYATFPPAYEAVSAWCGPYIEEETVAALAMMTLGAGNTIGHDLLNGESLYCDWFVFGAAPTTGYVQVHHRLCPDELPVEGATITEFQDECVEPGVGTPFSVLGDGGELSSALTDATGIAQLGEIPADDIMLVADMPDEYPFTVVYCFADYAFQPLEHTYTEEDRLATVGASMAWSLAADDLLECYWYSLTADSAPEAMEGGALVVEKYRCPLGVVEDADYQDYIVLCSQELDGVEFTVTHAGGSVTETTVGGKASWAGIPVGDYELQELLPPGFKEPLVFCSYTFFPQGGAGIIQKVDAPGGVMNFTMDGDGYEYTCRVFNILDETANTLTVRKSLCPEGFVGDANQAAAECTEPMDGVTFRLGAMEAVTGDWGPGTAFFPDVPAGDFEQSEVVPEGVGKVIYFGCYRNGLGVPTIVVQSDPPVVLLTFGAGDHWECWWYNVPEVTYDVIVHKRECAPGTEFVPLNAIPVFATINAECHDELDGIPFTIQHDDGTETLPTTNGSVEFNDVPAGMFSLTEEIPGGYIEPLWYCSFAPAGGPLPVPSWIAAPGGVLADTLDDPTGGTYVCYVFNFLDDDRHVTVWKWACPEGLMAESEDFQDWANTCVNHPSSIDFTVADVDGDVTKPVAGMEWWAPVAPGDVSITEHTPPAYHEPVVFCGVEAFSGEGGAYAEAMTMMTVTGSTVSRALDWEYFSWECHFFNVPKPKGTVTINKFQCPDGYDPAAMGVDPIVDCTDGMNGVTFTLTPQMGGAPLMQDTGDVIFDGVQWALDPGVYTIEETLPPGIDLAFIWSCVGNNIPAVHPQPLNFGTVFQIEVAPGDQVVCEWFNVDLPDDASVTVYKYLCWTPVFVSEVDCQIYEFGATFELVNGFDKSSYGVKVTDAFGKATWTPVDPGVHTLNELDGEACHIELSQDDGSGNPMVDMGEETVVHVYNCTDDSSTPGGKIPVKYPNTGVPSSTVVLPAIQATPSPDDAEPEYFPVRCLPAEATPASGTEDCPRGAIPEHIAIEAIGVDHQFEILEVIDGVMQQPTGPDVASWYKESGRLGEMNNTLVAGHLNFWGIPEGIFFSLHTLEEGDTIEVTGDDGRVYVYEVQWVRMESNLAPPAPEVIAATDEPSLTLITCGGSWNAAISEYDQRTVVRALLVDTTAAAGPLAGTN